MKPDPQDDARLALILRATLPPIALLIMGILFALSPKGGVFSEIENRNLARWPALTLEGLKRGQYTQGIDLYVADHFPLREALVSLSFLMREAWGFTLEETSVYLVPEEGLEDFDAWIDLHDEDLEAPPLAPVALGATPSPEAKAPAVKKPAARKPKKPKKAPTQVKEEMRKGVLVYGDRAIQLFGANLKLAKAYARVINKYRAAIHEDVRIFSIVVPTAVSFYLPDGHKYKRKSERAFIQEVYEHHAPGVIPIDAYSELESHVDELIYFRSDHHWTGRGAYYAYRALCKAAQIKPIALEAMERAVKPRYVGSLYRYTKASVIRENPEYVEYFKPKARYTAKYYAVKAQDRGVKTSFIKDKAYGYNVFLGGDFPMMIAETSNKNGKTALLIKNSYGNPLAPFLLPHFEKVIVVDYRYTSKEMLEVMKAHQVTDLIFLNVTLTAGSRYHRRKIEKIKGQGRYHPAP